MDVVEIRNVMEKDNLEKNWYLNIILCLLVWNQNDQKIREKV